MNLMLFINFIIDHYCDNNYKNYIKTQFKANVIQMLSEQRSYIQITYSSVQESKHCGKHIAWLSDMNFHNLTIKITDACQAIG